MRKALDRLESFVTAPRARLYAGLLLAAYTLGLGAVALIMGGAADVDGRPFGYDFATFWSAGKLIAAGAPSAVFDPAALAAVERTAAAGAHATFLWHYPPPFLLMVSPLGALPYGAAYCAWICCGAAAWAWTAGRIAAFEPWAPVMALALPASFICALHGQNGFFTASALGGGLLLLNRRPVLAGAILALLVCKPHVAALIPVLLLCTGRWRALGAMVGTAALLMALSAGIFGLDPWRAFLANLPHSSQVLEAGALPWAKIPTVFIAALWAGAPPALAYGLHFGVTGLACGLTIAAWRRPGSYELKGALAALATFTVSPYGFDYDLVGLGVAVAFAAAWSARSARRDPRLTAGMILVVLTPALGVPLATTVHVQAMPFAILTALVLTLQAHRRATAEPASTARRESLPAALHLPPIAR